MRDDMKRPELLMPAKDLEVLKTAVRYGADAVYIGGEAYGLRAKARNFSHEEMAEGIRYAHERGKKVYVTANIIAHNAELKEAERYFRSMREYLYRLTHTEGLVTSVDPSGDGAALPVKGSLYHENWEA